MSQPIDLDEIQAAITAYEQHPDIGFACCTAHPAADAATALLAEVRRLRAELAAEHAPFHLHSATAIADVDNPTQLRWGLDDVMWGDDDTITVLLSGPDREPYWLELDPARAAILRRNLAGPDGEQQDADDEPASV